MLNLAHILLADLVRRTWLVTVVAVIACSAFAARAVASLVEASYLAPAPSGAPPPPSRQEVTAPRPRPDGKSLVERNIFCSTCTAVIEPGSADSFVPDAVLIATSLGAEPLATLRVPGSEVQGSWGLGERIPGVGTVSEIGWSTIEITDATGRRGHLSLLAPGAATSARDSGPAAPATPWADRIRKIDDHTYEVERSLVSELVGGTVRPGGTRIMPVSENGKLTGLRIYGAGDSTIAGALGLHNGDVISDVNGKHIESANTLIQLYGQIDTLNTVELDGTRAGKPLGLTLRLR
jgi:hypothetical protein